MCPFIGKFLLFTSSARWRDSDDLEKCIWSVTIMTFPLFTACARLTTDHVSDGFRHVLWCIIIYVTLQSCLGGPHQNYRISTLNRYLIWVLKVTRTFPVFICSLMVYVSAKKQKWLNTLTWSFWVDFLLFLDVIFAHFPSSQHPCPPFWTLSLLLVHLQLCVDSVSYMWEFDHCELG